MALVTGGLGGLGLIASRELCVTGGHEKIVAMSRSGRAHPGLHEERIIEALQEHAVHMTIRCDLADCAGVTDAFKFADCWQGPTCSKAPGTRPWDDDAEDCARRDERPDGLGLLRSIIACLEQDAPGVQSQGLGGRMGVARLNRAARLRDSASAAVAASKEALRSRFVFDLALRSRFADYKDALDELTQLIAVLRREVASAVGVNDAHGHQDIGGTTTAPRAHTVRRPETRFAWRSPSKAVACGNEDNILQQMAAEMSASAVPSGESSSVAAPKPANRFSPAGRGSEEEQDDELVALAIAALYAQHQSRQAAVPSLDPVAQRTKP
eukprot:CAMPEP_0183493442 /NCGR_PEP_ID=MMETSP0370-20130417/183451_1 /TAXON_ID=268820 /ORGANISM="Peridinium aciculiferum, Strain PAER-2" /LENGTH=324 /DNA_ID=CAMNT_0025686785 /DNA_START=18 /DNA_END=993 /DNA_ORIENTATION=-